MKRKPYLNLIAILILAVSISGCRTTGGSTSKCNLAQWECGSKAYQATVEKFKVFDPNKVTPQTAIDGTKGGYTVDPLSAEFKAFEKETKDACLRSKGC